MLFIKYFFFVNTRQQRSQMDENAISKRLNFIGHFQITVECKRPENEASY